MSNKKHNIFDLELLGDFFKSKINLAILVSCISISLFIYLYFVSIQDLQIFPFKKDFSFVFYTDKNNGGNSEIVKQIITDSCITVEYDLKKGFVSPYIGLGIGRKDKRTFDISSYNQLQIEVEGNGMKSLGFSLFTQCAKDKYKPTSSQIIYSEKFTISSTRKTYIVEFDKLLIPDWWYSLNDIAPTEKISPPLKTVQSCNIGTAYDPVLGIRRTLQIHSIVFSRNNNFLILYLFVFNLIVLLLLFVIYVVRVFVSKKANAVVISYKAVDVENENKQLITFLDYINNNFHECELSLEQVSTETGINHRRIATYIQQNFNCNFKTYLNQLRINESKRLLKQSELNMGDIAFKVGFNTQSHFNRVFKSIVGISPSEYREKG
jgi:AraC-like DNA-binding protein